MLFNDNPKIMTKVKEIALINYFSLIFFLLTKLLYSVLFIQL